MSPEVLRMRVYTVFETAVGDLQVLGSWVAASPSSTPTVLHQLDILRSVVPESCDIWLIEPMR